MHIQGLAPTTRPQACHSYRVTICFSRTCEPNSSRIRKRCVDSSLEQYRYVTNAKTQIDKRK